MSDENQVQEESDIIAQRKAKLAELRERGNAFPNDFRRKHTAGELHAEHGEQSKEDLAENKSDTVVAGRIMLRRAMGKASFVTIQDRTGRIQAYIRQSDVGEDSYADFNKWDIGDIVGISGYMMKTNKGELSVHATELRLLTKSLRPLPEKHAGLTDTETKYRQRYLDLMVNDDTREVFRKRTKIVSTIRDYFNKHDFMEVETPMMQSTPGGATAAPFVTHYNALDVDMFLRV
ncbi:MAG: lysyl-tRNA synthetase class 2, partial [bacterium]